MAKPVWQQRLQARLDANPLYFGKGTAEDPSHTVTCKACGGAGKRVTLRMLVNYSFNTCKKCGYVCR